MASEHKYKYSKAYFKILELIQNNPNENVFVIRGGQGASKTISILELIIQALLSEEQECTILSSELSKMKRTVIRDYKKICKDWGVLASDDDFNRTESKHEYKNDSYLDFMGADVSDIGKGLRRNILYINEANKMDVETAIQLISRAGLTIIDYNPDKLFWGDEFINENNFITLTFLDNEFLPESEVRAILEYRTKGFYNTDLPFDLLFKESNIKSKYWANKWKVYGLGLVGKLDGVVFTNWSIGEFDNSIPNVFGQDYGFSIDPSVLINTAIDKAKKRIYVNECFCKQSMTTTDIEIENKRHAKTKLIIGDSSEPRLIDELKRKGLNIKGAVKGEGSVSGGIAMMQDYEIVVTETSLNIIKELNNYSWSDKKSGTPIDAYNHTIDAIRYAVMFQLVNPDIKRMTPRGFGMKI